MKSNIKFTSGIILILFSLTIFASKEVRIKFKDGITKIYNADIMLFSKADSCGTIHNNYVSQLIVAGNDTIRIPINHIDSILPLTKNRESQNYILSDNTTILDHELINHCDSVSKDGIYFDALAPKELLPSVGDILIARASQNIPDGFLGRILDVEIMGEGQIFLSTENVSLNEAFNKISLNETLSLKKLQQQKARSGNTANASQSYDVREYSFFCNKDNAVGGEGSIFLGSNISISIDIDNESGYNNLCYTYDDYCEVDMNGFCSIKTTDYFESDYEIVDKQFEKIFLLDSLLVIQPKRITSVQIKASGDVTANFQLKSGVSSKKEFVGLNPQYIGTSTINEGELSPWNVTQLGHNFDGAINVNVKNRLSLIPYSTQTSSDMESELIWTLSGHDALPEDLNYNKLKNFKLKYGLTNNSTFQGDDLLWGHIYNQYTYAKVYKKSRFFTPGE